MLEGRCGSARPKPRKGPFMFKFLASTVGIIFIIGLVVVVVLLNLIF